MQNEKDEVIELNYHDVLFVASGIDKDGNPRSGGTIAIDKVLSEDETKTLENAPMDCVFQIHSEGGAVVLQCDFSGSQAHEQSRVLTVCQNYMDRKNQNPENGELLSVLVVPIPLQGNISILFQGLTYYTGIDLGKIKRVVLVFDNTLTQLFQTDDVDMKEIQMSVEAELNRQRMELENQISEAQEELKKVQNNNQYEEMIQSRYSGVKIKKDEENDGTQIDSAEETTEQKKGRGDDTWED